MSILDNLAGIPSAHQQANESIGRSMSVTLAIVTDNADPQDQRRIKCSEPSSPNIDTYWVRRIVMYPQADAPLPRVGDTVLLFRIEDDPVNSWYLECTNNSNPPLSKTDPVSDFSEIIPGIRSRLVQGQETIQIEDAQNINVAKDRTVRTEQNQDTSAKLEVLIHNDAGASIRLFPQGVIQLQDAFGNEVVLGGASGGLGYVSDVIFNLATGNAVWNMNGGSVNWINCTDFTLSTTGSGGKTVLTIDSRDDANDDAITSGWN